MAPISIDNAGKLEIPLEIRQQLGLTNAQTFYLEVINGCIVLHPIAHKPNVHRYGTALVLETPPLDNLDTLIDDLREERIQNQLFV